LGRFSDPSDDRLGFLDGGDSLPIVGRRRILRRSVCQRKFVRASKFGVASSAAFGHAGETKRFYLSHGGRYGVAVNPVVHEIIERHRQLAIVCATVVSVLYLKAVENAARGKA
jgi:hypothetical protein